MDRMKQNLRIYDPAATRAEQTAANADTRKLAGLLAGLARLGSDVLGEKATEAVADLLRQAGELKRSA